MLELMAKGGMRAGEVLKLRAKDVNARRLHLVSPKSGRQSEVAFIPKKVADRLRSHIQSKGFKPEDRISPIHYTTARNALKNAGRLIEAFQPARYQRFFVNGKIVNIIRTWSKSGR